MAGASDNAEAAAVRKPLVRPRPMHKKKAKQRSNAGAAEAKAAATMTKEEWIDHQVGMADKFPVPSYMAISIPFNPATHYRDETYEIVTRWSAETKIQYRPHAKSPGTKSHLRYEVYSRAKTLGEALQLGSWPADWCWDYERGFIKVLGPVRDDPIDISAHTEDDPPLTSVDRKIYIWYNKELSKKLQVDYHSLFGTGEPTIQRAHRLVAQREAKRVLAESARAGRKVSDDDVLTVLKAWAFKKNAARVNVIPDGGNWVWSDTAGLLRDRVGSIHVTDFTKTYPEVIEVICRYLTDRLPKECAGFTFTSINMNYNYAARLHRDGNNFGPSIIKAFGDFTGGELNYWPEDDKSVSLEDMPDDQKVTLQIGPSKEGGLALFNGNSAHCVNEFKGDRFSIVYFTLGCHADMPQDQREILESVGMPVPAVDADRRSFLRAPRGFVGAAAGKRKAGAGADLDLPAVKFYPNAVLEKLPAKARKAKDDGNKGVPGGKKTPSKVGKHGAKAGQGVKKSPAVAVKGARASTSDKGFKHVKGSRGKR